jgi:hypothetical protein
MAAMETYRLTYAEAVEAANRAMERNFLNAQGDKVISAHFRGNT